MAAEWGGKRGLASHWTRGPDVPITMGGRWIVDDSSWTAHGWGTMSALSTRIKAFGFIAVAALCLGALPDSARDAAPPPSPRLPKLASPLFVEDFSDGLSRWRPDRAGVWTIRHGMLRAELPDAKQERSFLYGGDPTWTDYAVDLDVCMMRGVDKGIAVRVTGETGIAVDLRGPGYQDVLLQRREWPLGRTSAINANGVWHHLRVEAVGHRYRVFVDGELKLTRDDGHKAYPKGSIALPAYTGGGGECTVYYDNVVVSDLRNREAAQLAR